MKSGHVVGIVIAMITMNSPALAASPNSPQLPATLCMGSDFGLEFSEGEITIQVRGDGTGKIFDGPYYRWAITSFGVDPTAVCRLLQLADREGFFNLESSYPARDRIADGVANGQVLKFVSVSVCDVFHPVSYLEGHDDLPQVLHELECGIKELSPTIQPQSHEGRSSNYPLSPSHSGVTALAQGSKRRAGRARYHER